MKHKAAADTAGLDTEQRNPATQDLDRLSSLEIARVLNREDAKVARAVKKTLPQIGRAIDAIAGALSQGGRLIYVGTGTSGRIGALDASECPPTFNTDPKTVQFVMAGGVKALGAAIEANEDSRAGGRVDMAVRKPTRRDVVVGAVGPTWPCASLQGGMWLSASLPAGAPHTQFRRLNTLASTAPQRWPSSPTGILRWSARHRLRSSSKSVLKWSPVRRE